MARYGGHGCTILRTSGTKIAQVLSISGPSISRETIDTTDADATDDWRTFIASYIDGGEISLEINYDPDDATHAPAAGILLDFAATTLDNWSLVFSDASPAVTWTFDALVTGFEPSAPHDGVLTASVTLKIMGKITLA